MNYTDADLAQERAQEEFDRSRASRPLVNSEYTKRFEPLSLGHERVIDGVRIKYIFVNGAIRVLESEVL